MRNPLLGLCVLLLLAAIIAGRVLPAAPAMALAGLCAIVSAGALAVEIARWRTARR